MDPAKCPFRDQLLETHILGSETQLFGIAEDDAGLLASGDHPVAFRKIQCHRFFNNDVFARFGCQARDLAVQIVGDPENDEVHVLEVEQPANIGKVMRDSAIDGELLGVTGRWRCHGDHFTPRHMTKGFVMDRADEARADQTDAYRFHVSGSDCLLRARACHE